MMQQSLKAAFPLLLGSIRGIGLDARAVVAVRRCGRASEKIIITKEQEERKCCHETATDVRR